MLRTQLVTAAVLVTVALVVVVILAAAWLASTDSRLSESVKDVMY